MNGDDVPPGSSAHPPTLNDDEDGPEDRNDTRHGPAESQTNQEGSTSTTRPSRRRRRRKHVEPDRGLVKKAQFLWDLLSNLDMFVYAELATLYYLDCSTLRFFLRGWSQQNFLSPKPPDWPIPAPPIQAQVFSVFFPAAFCILCHIFESLPVVSEASRGYLHGGVIVDFIGQKPPSTRLVLLALDLIILAVQCLMLSVHGERQRLQKILKPKRTARRNTGAHSSRQDAVNGTVPLARSNTAERGETSTSNQTNDIEMENLDGNQGLDGQGDDTDESRPFLQPPASRTSLLDVMNSGNGMVGDFYVVDTLRSATPDFWGTVAHALQSVGYQATLARIRARVTGRQ